MSTLASLRTEFFARGFDYEASRADKFIDRAHSEICEMHPWPFLEATSSGTAPLTVSDLRSVLAVVDTTNDQELWGIDKRELLPSDPALDDTGTPTYWRLTTTSDSTTVRVWPVASVELTVHYLKIPTALTQDTDVPLVPSRYDQVLIDGAVIRAYLDSDDFDAAATLKEVWTDSVQQMAATLLHRNYANNSLIVRTDFSNA